MKLKLAILGTRGIPNNYGGFEHISAHLAEGLVKKGHSVTVYNSHNHPYQAKSWNGVELIHCYDPEHFMGTAGQFVYDFNCLMDARKRDFDVLLFMGYTSSSIWGILYPQNTVIITNMDGLEWKRTKYSKPVQRFLKYAEQLAVKYSKFYIADSLVIKSYLKEKYGINGTYIPYGAHAFSEAERNSKSLASEKYFMLMARMEPENNIETILQGFSNSNSEKLFKVIGNTQNKYGQMLVDKFKNDIRIQFLGANFDNQAIRFLQHHSQLYFHGHSVGGTNPSLLEAMATESLIAAHDNPFNQSILGKDAFYFSNTDDVLRLVETVDRNEIHQQMVQQNVLKIKSQFNWEKVTHEYEALIIECYQNVNNEKLAFAQR